MHHSRRNRIDRGHDSPGIGVEQDGVVMGQRRRHGRLGRGFAGVTIRNEFEGVLVPHLRCG